MFSSIHLYTLYLLAYSCNFNQAIINYRWQLKRDSKSAGHFNQKSSLRLPKGTISKDAAN